MLVSAFLYLIMAVLYALGAIFPIGPNLPAGFTGSFALIVSYISKIYSLFPFLDALFISLKWLIYFELAFWTFKFFNWIYNKIRGSGG